MIVAPGRALLILIELSNRINIFAGTSPSPDPGGSGFE
jgi:hypothetical protein